jgi:hypothetical protein
MARGGRLWGRREKNGRGKWQPRLLDQSAETTMAEPWQHRDAAAALQASHLSARLRSSIAMAQRPTSPGIELYKSIGANPVINGIGSVTFLVRTVAPLLSRRRVSRRRRVLAELISLDAARARGMQGGSTPDPRVEEAMDAANGSFVPMDDLQKVRTFRSSSAPVVHCMSCRAARAGHD